MKLMQILCHLTLWRFHADAFSIPNASKSSTISRRKWIITETTSIASLLSTVSVASTLPSQPALAVPTTKAVTVQTVTLKPPSSAAEACLCDPSVSTFLNPKNRRLVHILGTAHISSASADVAGQLVRELKPSAVFVELDQKRVARAIPKEKIEAHGALSSSSSSLDSTSTNNKLTRFNSDNVVSSTMNLQITSSSTTPDDELVRKVHTNLASSNSISNIISNPFNLKEKLLNQASQVVGNSIKALYQKLESEGFSAGEEFVVAVREGLKVNSKIILGDQDVEVTLRRLTEALAKTDFKKLVMADAELEENMKSFFPDKTMASSSSNTSMSKEEFSYFVETVKAKDNVRMLMANLERSAPEIYNAMVRERDLYMANGLDQLNQFESIVAVMGIAHVDGVERTLKERGWVPVNYNCKVR